MKEELIKERNNLLERTVRNYLGYWDNDFMIAFSKGFFAAFEFADKEIEAVESKLDVAKRALERIEKYGDTSLCGEIAGQALKEMERGDDIFRNY